MSGGPPLDLLINQAKDAVEKSVWVLKRLRESKEDLSKRIGWSLLHLQDPSSCDIQSDPISDQVENSKQEEIDAKFERRRGPSDRSRASLE